MKPKPFFFGYEKKIRIRTGMSFGMIEVVSGKVKRKVRMPRLVYILILFLYFKNIFKNLNFFKLIF
jgi:hypothetical protein